MQRRERCDNVSFMNANPKLWQFVCAVIVLIAVQFAPALARAHGDHAHRLQAHVHAHHHAVVDHVAKADFNTADLNKADFVNTASAEINGSVSHELFLTAGRPSCPTPIDSDGCVDGCCGAGMGCCGAAALAATSQSLNLAMQSHRLDFTGALLASGIEPASLRKPPRPLA